ncbi:MAG TPA: imidazolonepropionase [Acidobacteriota bacterium]|nr:imidazolonepropionase [Acidobacteriota bacterium]
MPVLSNIEALAACREEGGQSEIHLIEDAALVWEGDLISWVGRRTEVPSRYRDEPLHDARGALVVPGLIDCHTHLAFGGWRADEFAQRIAGTSYLDIARAGGGIARTVRETRAISSRDLLGRCDGFLDQITRLGVTTVECKSGYGLDWENEHKLLKVYERLAHTHPLRVIPTFLGAHTLPPEMSGDRQRYVRLIIEEMIPQVAEEGLAGFCDVFVEDTAFTIDEARQILEAGLRHGLKPKLHADQLSDTGGASLAAEMGAVSADHLEQISRQGIEDMANAGVVAVSLPLASLYLDQPFMPARDLIEAGVAVAVATDFNPGSAPSFHLPLAMMLACTRQRMTPSEVLKGVTLYAARALDLEDRLGSLEPGKEADFTLIDAPSVDHWLYHFRSNACLGSYVAGVALQRPAGR